MGRCRTHPITTFALAEFHKKPWIPAESSHTRALGDWGTMNENHKRHSKLERGFQAWIAYNIRFILAGDLASAWETFGGISMQLTHLGTGLNLAIAENATIAMTYDAKVRTYANELSKFRTSEKAIINILKDGGRRIKREGLRERGSAPTFAPRNADVKRKSMDKWKGKDKGHKGKGPKGKGENKSRGKQNWPQNSDWNHNNDWANRPSNDWNNNKPSSSNDDGGQTSAPTENQENQANDKPSKKRKKQ